jgi:6-pyruvoyltetrahydropterin/6-carboxytetrahydropterin synthase
MLIATIAKRFTFDAAHRLEHLPADHKCNRLHGHTYTVELEITGPVGIDGFVIDYQVLADAWAPLHEMLDHRYLNEVRGLGPPLGVPSTEHLALWILRRLVNDASALALSEGPPGASPEMTWTLLSAVTVEESSSTWCRVTTDAVRRGGGVERRSLISYA